MDLVQRWSRRQLLGRLWALAGLAVAATIAPLRRLRPRPGADSGEDPTAARLAALAGPPESARAVGAEYLRSTPEERDPALLAQRLASGLAPGAPLRPQLARRIRADFEQERVVSLRGWVVSRTEARLCALAALRLG